jgi:hypothetical protein
MINFITSLNFDLFQKYGLKFFETFDKFAGDDCKLIVVFEGETSDNLKSGFKCETTSEFFLKTFLAFANKSDEEKFLLPIVQS